MEGASSGPPALCLITTDILEQFFAVFRFPQWQLYLPFELGNVSLNGCLSSNLSKANFEYHELLSYRAFLSKNNLNHGLSSLYTFACRTPTTSLGCLTTKDSLIVLTLLVITIRHIKAVSLPIFCNFGRNVGISTHGPQWETKNRERIMKFGEYVFRFLYHSILSAVGMWYFWDAPWWEKGGTTTLWMDFPNQSIEVGMIWYYLIQSAYNIDALISLMEHSVIVKIQSLVSLNTKGWQCPIKLLWSPNIRGDFREMALHHVITNFLVIGSSQLRLTRIGSMVFMIHDISDIPVDMSKLANFMKWKITTCVCFVVLLIAWVFFRLGILPFVVFKSILTESPDLYNDGELDLVVYHMYLPLFKMLIGGLIALHLLWFIIITRIGLTLVTKGETHDLSEHKNGENQISTDKVTSVTT